MLVTLLLLLNYAIAKQNILFINSNLTRVYYYDLDHKTSNLIIYPKDLTHGDGNATIVNFHNNKVYEVYQKHDSGVNDDALLFIRISQIVTKFHNYLITFDVYNSGCSGKWTMHIGSWRSNGAGVKYSNGYFYFTSCGRGCNLVKINDVNNGWNKFSILRFYNGTTIVSFNNEYKKN